MNAEEAISLIQSMPPAEIERLLVFMKEYETELRRHPVAGSQDTTIVKGPVPTKGTADFHLAAMERREREAQSNLE
jgi:hypothetical protein